MDIQLVLLNFCEATEEQEEELIAAADSCNAARVEQILQRPQSPDTSLEAMTPLGSRMQNGDLDSVRFCFWRPGLMWMLQTSVMTRRS